MQRLAYVVRCIFPNSRANFFHCVRTKIVQGGGEYCVRLSRAICVCQSPGWRGLLVRFGKVCFEVRGVIKYACHMPFSVTCCSLFSKVCTTVDSLLSPAARPRLCSIMKTTHAHMQRLPSVQFSFSGLPVKMRILFEYSAEICNSLRWDNRKHRRVTTLVLKALICVQRSTKAYIHGRTLCKRRRISRTQRALTEYCAR